MFRYRYMFRYKIMRYITGTLPNCGTTGRPPVGRASQMNEGDVAHNQAVLKYIQDVNADSSGAPVEVETQKSSTM
jgi:hypothetical protein